MSHPDLTFMALAIQLAANGRFTTSPNPNVGCVIVKQGQIVGQGWHQQAGGPHAEVVALAQAGALAKGATCYVTLEPCSHFGKTPPCADALITAEVKRVVVAMVDPNPLVSGKGLQKLAAAGIETEVGVLQADAQRLNRGFIKRMQGKGAWVTCKMASSLDGKTALANGVSQWITGPAARADVQRFRAQSCAIISSATTVIADNASLTVRWRELGQAQAQVSQDAVRQPVRVIIDSQNRLTPTLKLFQQSSPIILIRVNLDNQQQWPHFVEQWVLPQRAGNIDLSALVDRLSQHGFNQLWIEAGATLAGAFLAMQLVDELILYQAPKLIGGQGRSLVALPVYDQMDQVTDLTITDIRQVGPDLRITAILEPH